MLKVAILPVPTETGDISYRAVAGNRQSLGKTAGEALDALTAQFPEDEMGVLIIVQNQRPDRFFNAEQQKRLTDLMESWRAARDMGEILAVDEQAELEKLIDMELRASAERAAELANELRQ